MTLVREMPVFSAAQLMAIITDKHLWRVVYHYVGRAMYRLD